MNRQGRGKRNASPGFDEEARAMSSEDHPAILADPLVSTLLSASSSLIIIVDGYFNIIALNPAAKTLTAATDTPAIGQSIISLLPLQDQGVVQAHLMVMQQSQLSHSFQLLLGNRLLTASLHPVFEDECLMAVVMIADDETEQKRMEDDLFLSNQILSTVQHPMAIMNDQEQLQRVNDAFISVFAPDQKKLENVMIADILGVDNYEKIFGTQLEEARKGVPIESQNWYELPRLGRRYMRTHLYPLFSGRQAVSGLVLHVVDLTEMKQMEEKLHLLSITDVLTGLFNRNHFQIVSEAEMARSARYGIPLSYIMFDIDHFKGINDNYGHDTGDDILKAISQQVRAQIRDTDSMFRWGGEEFVLLLPHTTCNESVVLAERIRMGIEQINHEKVGTVTCSFGVTAYHGSESGQQLFSRLDELLYESKRSGRNRVTAE